MDALVTPPGDAVADALGRSRAVAAAWAALPVARRLTVIARTRRLIGDRAAELAGLVARPAADTLVAEVLPLAAAAAWLVRHAGWALRPRPARGRRPVWLAGVRSIIRREPMGVVLILGPGNYPLFLPGVQALQALAAGNAVCVKPAPGGGAVMQALAGLLAEAGLPAGVLQVLEDSAETGRAAARAAFDKIVLTGSAETGRSVLAACADGLRPAVVELSGNDAVFVLPGADLELVASCLAYGLRLNAGATCIAPRRVFVLAEMAERLEAELTRKLAGMEAPPMGPRLAGLVSAALAEGARLVRERPVVLAAARPEMALLVEDVFAPWLAIVPVAGPDAALAAAAQCPYALGASVFGPETAARAFATRVHAGSVCVNDVIVPTADPRLPFGGRGRSGFGATRGEDGLLEMTAAKAISVRRGRFRPHLHAPRPGDEARFAALVAMLHGGWRARAAALRQLARR